MRNTAGVIGNVGVPSADGVMVSCSGRPSRSAATQEERLECRYRIPCGERGRSSNQLLELHVKTNIFHALASFSRKSQPKDPVGHVEERALPLRERAGAEPSRLRWLFQRGIFLGQANLSAVPLRGSWC